MLTGQPPTVRWSPRIISPTMVNITTATVAAIFVGRLQDEYLHMSAMPISGRNTSRQIVATLSSQLAGRRSFLDGSLNRWAAMRALMLLSDRPWAA